MELGDPCYEGDKVQTNFVRGNYHCFINVVEIDDWGKRVQRMWVEHEDHINKPKKWHSTETMLGVDAGLMSINTDGYQTYDTFLPKLEKAEKEQNPFAQIIDKRHFVSSSGYGDGNYPVAVSRENGDIGLIAALGIVFIYNETHPYLTEEKFVAEHEMNV